jgi:DNA-binding phage protein
MRFSLKILTLAMTNRLNQFTVGPVTLTDENGRHLGALLNYLLDGNVTNQQICLALGMSTSGYYRRIKQDDFPNVDELHKLARAFGLNFADLQVRLGFLTREDLEDYLNSHRFPSSATGRHTEMRVASRSLYRARG